jgi:hypothetical protein
MFFLFKIIKDAAAFRLGHFNFTASKLNKQTIMPAIEEYADALIETMQEYFNGDIRYQGDMADGFGKKKLSNTSLAITQSALHEQFIRRGTKGPYKGFPYPVVKWAEQKLNYSNADARKVAGSIMQKGTSEWFRRYPPFGEPRFEYPEAAIKDTEKEYRDLVNRLGSAIVRWITVGDSWKVKVRG